VIFIDFKKRKSVHVSLLTETHKDFRKFLIDNDLSMQEVFQKFSELAIEGDKRATRIVEDLVKEKREGMSRSHVMSFDSKNLDNIYKLIEGEKLDSEDEDA